MGTCRDRDTRENQRNCEKLPHTHILCLLAGKSFLAIRNVLEKEHVVFVYPDKSRGEGVVMKKGK